jgi:signal transduction histidine kinase
VEFLAQGIPKAIQQSLEGLNNVARIVRAMNVFSHPNNTEKTLTDLNKAIDATLTVARNEWKHVAEIVKDFDETLPRVPCLSGSFNQVILNLVINAAHAIAEKIGANPAVKGTITISTGLSGGVAEIRVRDTGTGIPEAIRDKIFDPFFTTKPLGKGTGQGLAIAHGVVVDQHGGSLSFETEVGRGTVFIIRLPIQIPSEIKQTAKTTP